MIKRILVIVYNILKLFFTDKVVSFIKDLLGIKSLGESADQFNERASIFNSNIPNFVDEVLLRVYPELRKYLLKVEIEGQTKVFPVVPLIEVPELQAGKALIVIPKTLKDEKDVRDNDKKLIKFIQLTGREIEEGPVFRLLGIAESPSESEMRRELTIGTTTYFKTLSACDTYYYNMIRSFPKKPKGFRFLLMRQPRLFKDWRNDISLIIESRPTVFNHISAGLGISVFTVFNIRNSDGGNNYKYACIRKSDKTNATSERHVIPSFMYEPVTASRSEQIKELDIRYQTLKEFAEEFMGVKEMKTAFDLNMVRNHILKNKACKSLDTLLNNGKAQLEITGLWVDAFRLRPEITCILLIDDQEFYLKYGSEFMGNWELRRQSCEMVDLLDQHRYEELLQDPKTPLCPPGIAAIVSGRKLCIKHLGLAPEQT